MARAEAAASWIPAPLYPTGGAAGPLLLYILIRTLNESEIDHVLDLGAGQTTRVVNAWAARGNGHLVTFEQDPVWATSLRAEVDRQHTRVLHLPLEEFSLNGTTLQWYSSPPPGTLPTTGFDLLIVDGPVGTERLSRYGIIPHVPEWLNQEWAIIWDDLQRPADLESFALLIERLRSLGVAHDHIIIGGERIIGLVFTPKYSAMRYML